MDASVRLRQNRVGGINKKNKAQDLVCITCNAIGSQIRKKKSFCKHLQKRKKKEIPPWRCSFSCNKSRKVDGTARILQFREGGGVQNDLTAFNAVKLGARNRRIQR